MAAGVTYVPLRHGEERKNKWRKTLLPTNLTTFTPLLVGSEWREAESGGTITPNRVGLGCLGEGKEPGQQPSYSDTIFV